MRGLVLLGATGLLLTSLGGCAAVNNLLGRGGSGGRGGVLGGGGVDADWQKGVDKLSAAEKLAAPTDKASLEAAWKGWEEAGAAFGSFESAHCKDGKGGYERATPERCAEAAAKRKEIFDKQVAIAEAGTKLHADDTWAFLQDEVMWLDRYGLGPVPIDTWIDRVAGDKLSYWKGEITKRGGMAKWGQRKGEPLCLPFDAKPNARDSADHLNFQFSGDATVTIKCWFPKPPASFQRDDGDYWSVLIRWGDKWEIINLTYDVARPSDSNWVTFELPADMVAEKMQDKVRKQGFEYPGSWVRVKAAYMTRYITGHEWVKGVLQDVWKHQEMIATTFYYKYK